MFDLASASDSPGLQRAVGQLHVALKLRGAATVLADLRQAGCLKARLPRRIVDEWADVVTLNTSGGVAAGDRLDARFEVQCGARATIAAQAAERFYRATPGAAPAAISTHIAVADGAMAEWLPQETILFDQCAMSRRLEVVLAGSASFTGVETLVFGRTAMGETVQLAWIRDLIRIHRDGTLVLHDAVRLDGAIDALLQRKAIGGGARAMASLLHAAADAEGRLNAVRSALDGMAVECGVSAWNGVLVARVLADTAARLRPAIIAALQILRDARPLPRVWLC